MLEEVFSGSQLGLERGSVRLAPSNPAWTVTFHRLAAWMITSLPASVVTIEHIGSTAVPRLPAKPILDIAVGAAQATDGEEITAALVDLGFLRRGEAEDTLDRNFGLEDPPRHRLVNAHLVTYIGTKWNHYLTFRDRLRADADARDEYATLKSELARQHTANGQSDRLAHVAGKDDFVSNLIGLDTTPPLPEPKDGEADQRQMFLRYLDYYRSQIIDKLSGLRDEQVRETKLPSGWTPLELIKHLIFMERRWFRWGFLAEQVDRPWGDADQASGRWQVDTTEQLDQLVTRLRHGGERTRTILENSTLDQFSALGGRFSEDPPRLDAICFHVLQEYARHAGHLDVVRELIDGRTGE